MLYLALPVLNEFNNLPALMASLKNQRHKDFKLIVCVNQYDHYWEDDSKRVVCEDNRKSIEFLRRVKGFEVQIIDRSSKGKGWPVKKGGVGFARKVIMDSIAAGVEPDDVIISIDADTFYPEDYLQVIDLFFKENRGCFGLSLPYYHPLPDEETVARQILRYELYMRYYALNMIRIKNPYRFTALGSAMAFTVYAYKKTGGLTPVAAGEDFYYLQKLVKTVPVEYTAGTIACPSARLSDRVNFGTGPALIKGIKGDWLSYPFYHYSFFDEVAETFAGFRELYYKPLKLPMDDFFQNRFGTADIWSALRNNYKDVAKFEKACINKADGLRILQFLRYRQRQASVKDEQVLTDYLNKFYRDFLSEALMQILKDLDFEKTPVNGLNELRNFMFAIEQKERKRQAVWKI